MRGGQSIAIGGLVLGLVACSPEVEESLTTTAADDSASTTGAPSTSVTMTDASVSVSDDDGSPVTSGSDDAEPTEDSAVSGTEPSTGAGELESEGGSGEEDSGEGTTDAESTGESPVDCEPLDRDACDGAGGQCMALLGRPFVHLNGMNYCAGDEEFAACADMHGCDDQPTVACDGDDQAWLFPSGCLPGGWDTCDAPGNGDLDFCE